MMTIFSGDSETAWSIYHKIIKDVTGGDESPVVVLPTAIATRAEWDSTSAEYNAFLQQDFANAMPEWRSLYTRSPGRNIGDEYEAFLDRLSSKFIEQSPVNKERLKELDEARRVARTNLKNLEAEIREEWTVYVRETPEDERLPRNRWEQEFGYSADRASYQQELQIAGGAYFLEVTNAGGRLAEIGRAIAAKAAKEAKIELPSSKEPFILNNSSTWESYYTTQILGDINQFKSEKVEQTFTVNESQETSTTYTSRWGGGASFQWFSFFGAGGSIDNVSKQRSWEENTLEVKITFGNLAKIPIRRGQWFKGGLVREFLEEIDKEFWGSRGRLNLIPTELLLAHTISLDIKTSDEAGTYAYEHHNRAGNAGFRFGPFRFGGSGGSTSTSETTTVEKTTTGLQVKDISGRAAVLAVICERPADLLPGGIPPAPFFMIRNRPTTEAAVALEAGDEEKYIEFWNQMMKEASQELALDAAEL
jgi:hypothetical protein